jgi:predicted RNA-binding Zn-ribbon protein involved in translation (DUF1610 family)
MPRHKCGNPKKDVYADCFDCLIHHQHEHSGLVMPEPDAQGRIWTLEIEDNSKKWVCPNCGTFKATIAACSSCRQES